MKGSHANIVTFEEVGVYLGRAAMWSFPLLLVLGLTLRCTDTPQTPSPVADPDLVQMDRIDIAILEMETLDRDDLFQGEAAQFRQVNQQIYAELRQARQRQAEGDTLAAVIIDSHMETRRLLLESIEEAQRILREREGLTE